MKAPPTIEGQWHIFGDDKPAPYGTLRIDSEEGLALETKMPRSQGQAHNPLLPTITCPETIHGIDSCGEPVTLLGCMVSEASNSVGLDTLTVHPLLAITGGHFSSWPTIMAQTVRARFSILDAWLNRSTIQTTLAGETTAFTQKALPLINVPLGAGTEIVISCGYTHQHGVGELHLTQAHSVHFNFNKPERVSKVRGEYLYVFQQLLTLLSGSQTFSDEIQFSGHDLTKYELLSSNNGAASANRKISQGHILVHYHEVEAGFPALVARWFRYYSEMEAILNLYFTARWNNEVPLTTKFLLLAQALEAFHNRSRKYTSAAQPKPEFRKRIDALLKGVSDRKEADWLREKLQHANQKTLAQRLGDLMADHQKEIASFVSDPGAFATTVRHTRNYFTHFDEDLRRKGKIPDTTTLAKTTLQMRALLELCFVRDLQLPEAAAQRVTRRVQNIGFVSIESPTAKA